MKRLIGLPGEVWSERGGFVYIDGAKLKEPHVADARRDGQNWGAGRIPPGHCFFMGDNRKFSCDSRRWGTVPRADIVGDVLATYWPPSRSSLR